MNNKGIRSIAAIGASAVVMVGAVAVGINQDRSSLGADARYAFRSTGMRPYLGAGFGLHFLSSAVDAPSLGLNNESHALVKGGLSILGGLAFPLAGRFENFVELKYHHIPSCPLKGACRSVSFGLPYWPRLKLYMKRSYVPLLNVQDSLRPFWHAVGSPSLSAGKYAARIGWVAKGVIPKTSAAAAASSRRQRSSVRGRRTSTATATATDGSMPAM